MDNNIKDKENNKNAGNGPPPPTTKFIGGNLNLSGKIFDVGSREAIHYFTETVKSIADYVGQEYTHGRDIRFMIENLSDFNLVRPDDPDENANQYEIESWKKQLDLFWR